MTKYKLAAKIENHHLYEPREEGVYSKNYYRYNSDKEISILMKEKKYVLQDMYNQVYSDDGRELKSSEINW